MRFRPHQVGSTYRYCVAVASQATSVFFLNRSTPLDPVRFISEPVCRDVTIQWAGKITGEVRTKFDTPAPGVRLTARLLGSSYVISTLTDDSGRYTLQLQGDVGCDAVLAPESCLNQLVRWVVIQPRPRTLHTYGPGVPTWAALHRARFALWAAGSRPARAPSCARARCLAMCSPSATSPPRRRPLR
jgi:hypothetical protein